MEIRTSLQVDLPSDWLRETLAVAQPGIRFEPITVKVEGIAHSSWVGPKGVFLYTQEDSSPTPRDIERHEIFWLTDGRFMLFHRSGNIWQWTRTLVRELPPAELSADKAWRGLVTHLEGRIQHLHQRVDKLRALYPEEGRV